MLEDGIVLGVMGKLPPFSLGDGVYDDDGLARPGEGVGKTDVAGVEVMREVGDDEMPLVRAGEADVVIVAIIDSRGLTEGVGLSLPCDGLITGLKAGECEELSESELKDGEREGIGNLLLTTEV